MRSLKSSKKCSKTTWNSPEQLVKLIQKLVIETTAQPPWFCYFITIAAHSCAATIEGL